MNHENASFDGNDPVQPAPAPAQASAPGTPGDPNAALDHASGEQAQRRPKPDMEVVRAARARRKRRGRIAAAVAVGMVLCVIAVAVTDSVLASKLVRMYSEQPWVRVARAYREIDEGAVLAVHREQAVAHLDREFLNREGWVMGFVTAIGEPRETESGLKTRILVDAPNFDEVVNLFEDDVRVEVEPAMAASIRQGEMILARGVIDNYSRWGLWITAASIRPLTSIEKHYVQRAIPPTSFLHEPIGFDALARRK